MGEFDPFCREFVEVRSADLRVGEAAQVPVAEVITQEDDDVRLLGGDGGEAGEVDEPQPDQETERQMDSEGIHGVCIRRGHDSPTRQRRPGVTIAP